MKTGTCKSSLQRFIGTRAFSQNQNPKYGNQVRPNVFYSRNNRNHHKGIRGVRAARLVAPKDWENMYPAEPNTKWPTPRMPEYSAPLPDQMSEEAQLSAIFAKDSTTELIKKYFVYKLMGSNLFINHSLTLMNVAYKTLGIRTTNFVINKSVGSLFTSGESIQTLVEDIAALEKNNINGVGNYVVEGLAEMDDEFVQGVHEHMLESIHAQTESKAEGHFALKLTALISTDTMTRLSRAQQILMNDILKFDKQLEIDISDLKNSLLERGINFSEQELQSLFSSLQFENNKTDKISRLEIYANAHLFRLDSGLRSDLLRRIAVGCGVGVSEDDLQIFSKFSERLDSIGQLAQERNCMLYVDAEQTFMQAAIESFGQQLTHKYNRGEQHIIMNGYQCYLRRMSQVIRHEVATSKALGYNLGVKLIRGAYMNEERALAEESGYESPIWGTIEETHACYNEAMLHVIENLRPHSMLFVASHNAATVDQAKNLIRQKEFGDHRVRFGQLKAFSDQITGQLAQEDFKVYKYLPYGPTEKVMPYLIRRGQESKQVLREQEFQNVHLKKEIQKRLSPFSRHD